MIQIARGHRKTSLLDETLYPIALPVPGGHKLCLPYLTALIRLADEIDVTSARNSSLLYDMDAITEDRDIFEFKKHLAIPELRITEDAFTVVAQTEEPRILEGIHRMRGKMQHTLDECREAVLGRTPYVITQKRVLVCDVSGRTA